ncbi:MAG: helix-turn-helix domain-containing protein [Nocardioidaceae bacterium]
MKLIVRRRAALMAAIVLPATALSAGYVWRFAQTHDQLALLIAGGLGLIAVLHAVAWTGARSPLLVADDTGLLVRGGGGWTGVPWQSVERVEVRNQGRLSDGRVTVVPAQGAEISRPSSWRSRVATAVSKQEYDDSLVVAFGLTTSVSAPDVVAALRRLADGRASIVIPGGVEEPEPTVELSTASATVETPDPDAGRGLGAVAENRYLHSAAPSELEPVTFAAESGNEGRRPKRRLLAVEAAPVAPLTRVVSTLKSRPAARREEVLVAHDLHGSDGALALSPQPEPESEFETDSLPEIGELRRPPAESRRATDSSAELGADLVRGNVGLIIDATTDLSARAMRKVRRPAAVVQQVAPATELTAAAQRPDSVELVIGIEIAEARQRLGLSTDELGERTRIRAYVIESIEANNFGPCGGDFYARGHLRMLARVLGLDPEPLVECCDKHFAMSPIRARDVFEVELAAGTTGMLRGGDSRANWGAPWSPPCWCSILLWGLAGYFADQGEATVQGGQPPQNVAGLGSARGRVTLGCRSHSTPTVKVTARDGDAHVVVEDRFGQVVFDGFVREGTSKRLAGESPLRVSAADGGVTALVLRRRRSTDSWPTLASMLGKSSARHV